MCVCLENLQISLKKQSLISPPLAHSHTPRKYESQDAKSGPLLVGPLLSTTESWEQQLGW